MVKLSWLFAEARSINEILCVPIEYLIAGDALEHILFILCKKFCMFVQRGKCLLLFALDSPLEIILRMKASKD